MQFWIFYVFNIKPKCASFDSDVRSMKLNLCKENNSKIFVPQVVINLC